MEIEDPNKNRGKGRGNQGGYIYTDEELLDKLKQYRKKHGKVPSQTTFVNNSEYPGFTTYINRFGCWSNALKLVGFDADSMVKEGNLLSTYHKARLGELLVFNSFKEKNKAVDLSGKNYHSIFDGFCPKGHSYDVKIASLQLGRYYFAFRNKELEKIEYFYLVAVNREYTELHYIWLVPQNELRIVNRRLSISVKKRHKYNKYLIDFSKCNLDFLNKKEQ